MAAPLILEQFRAGSYQQVTAAASFAGDPYRWTDAPVKPFTEADYIPC
jgi:hypothetical protein